MAKAVGEAGRAGGGPPLVDSRLAVLVLTVLITAVVCTAQWLVYWTPQPVPADAPAAVFSEARARRHVHVLTVEIGDRQVSTPGLHRAQEYLQREGRRLAAAAAARPAQDLTVTVDAEVTRGAAAFDFVGHRGVNAFRRLTNVFIQVAAAGQEGRKGIMVVAHPDSPISSTGASDDASNVGVMLELAATLVAAPSPPPVPVVFFFSGGEEPLCQSAVGFTQSSRWRDRVAAFINLESIGPGGLPIVFQHSGAWTIRAFARGAAYPRGAIAAQDIFDSGLVLGETDYRMLSYRHHGHLPGIDLAYVLDGAAYHTDRDTLERVRRGTLQEMGETLGGAVAAMAEDVAAAGDDPAALAALTSPSEHKAVFMSVASGMMLTYSFETARLLHNAPLALLLGAPAALRALYPKQALPVGQGVVVMVAAAGLALASMVLTLAGPAALGALRAALSGRAIVWYSWTPAAFLTFYPAAVACSAAPWLLAPPGRGPPSSFSTDFRSPGGRCALPYHVLGAGLANAAIAAALAHVGVGGAFFHAMWGAAALLAAPFAVGGLTLRGLLCVLLACLQPLCTCAEMILPFTTIIAGRMNLTGHFGIGVGDAVAGVLMGLAVQSLHGGVLVPVACACLSRRTARRAAAAALAVSLAVAAASSLALFPYSHRQPMRLALEHAHFTEPAGGAPPAAPGGGGNATGPPPPPLPMRVVNSTWSFGGADSNSISELLLPALEPEPAAFAPARELRLTGRELATAWPVSTLMDAHSFPAPPPPGAGGGALPYVRVVADEAAEAAAAGAPARRRVRLEVVSYTPCWGLLNLTGRLHGWDLLPDGRLVPDGGPSPQPRAGGAPRAERAQQAGEEGEGGRFFVRFTSEEEAMVWPLELLADASGKVRLELHVAVLGRTPPLQELVARLPEWAALTFEVTTYTSVWEF